MNNSLAILLDIVFQQSENIMYGKHRNSSLLRGLTLSLLVVCGCVASIQAQMQTFTIAGHVTRASDGQPVQASVCLYSTKSLNDNSFYMMYKGTTDDKGLYSFSMTGNALYKVVCFPWDSKYETQYYSNSDRLETATALTLTSNQNNVDFALKTKTVYDNGIRGVVVDSKGAIVQATLSAWQVNDPNSQSYYASTDKSTTGTFTFTNLKPGSYMINVAPASAAYASGYYRANGTATKDATLATVVTVSTSGFVSPDLSIAVDDQAVSTQKFGVKGMVIDEDGVGVEGATLTLSANKGASNIGKAMSTTGGMFYIEFEGLMGEYTLVAQKSGYSDARVMMPFDEKNPYQAVTLVMQAVVKTTYNNTVSGRVRDTKDASVFAKVTAVRVLADGSVAWNNAQTTVASISTTGEFMFTNLRPGSYVLYASPANASLASGYYVDNATATADAIFATRIDVAEKGSNTTPYVITLGQNTTKISYDFYGYVIDELNAPLADVKISVTDANGNEILINQINTTDEKGFFHCVFPGPGVYSMRMTKDGYQDASGTLSFTSANYAQKSLIIMARKQGTKSMPDAAIIADVQTEVSTIESVYPQPARDNIVLSLSDTRANELRIYDVNGILESSQQISSQTTLRCDVSSLSTGVHLVRLFNNGSPCGTRMFVKE